MEIKLKELPIKDKTKEAKVVKSINHRKKMIGCGILLKALSTLSKKLGFEGFITNN
jgi:hypothetical protein